jgi:hypothetical protein
MKKVIIKHEDNQKELGPVRVLNTPDGSEIAPEPESALRRAAEKIVALNKKSGAHAFDLGCTFAEAKPLVPEKAFGKWLRTFSDYTVRSVWNYISIHERLQDYREQLLSHAVMPTVMFELAKGEPAQIEMVIAKMADGERIRVKDVREMLGRKPKNKSDVAKFDTAGVAGLRKAAAAKTDEDIARFQELMVIILKEIEAALEPLAMKKSVKKGELSKSVHLHCRHAHDLLNSVAAPLVPDATSYMNWRSAKLPDGSVWRKVQDLLHRMGGEDQWAKGKAFVPWLQDEVVPLFRFVVHGEAVAGDPYVDDADASDTERLIPFDLMPALVKEQVEEALETISPESRDDIRNLVYFDPTPSKRRAA